MKRSWIITILFCLLLLGVGVTVILLPQTVPYSQCSELYQRYASVDGIDATFIRDYQVNDTLAIDATLLHATDSASWERLREELRIPEPNPMAVEYIKKGKDIVKVYLSRKGGAAQEMDKENLNNNDVVGVSYLNQSISIYHTCSKEQRTAIINYNYDISTNKQ